MSRILTTIKDVFMEAISFIGILLFAVLYATVMTIILVVAVPIAAIVMAIVTRDSLVDMTFDCYSALIKGIKSQLLNDNQEIES